MALISLEYAADIGKLKTAIAVSTASHTIKKPQVMMTTLIVILDRYHT